MIAYTCWSLVESGCYTIHADRTAASRCLRRRDHALGRLTDREIEEIAPETDLHALYARLAVERALTPGEKMVLTKYARYGSGYFRRLGQHSADMRAERKRATV